MKRMLNLTTPLLYGLAALTLFGGVLTRSAHAQSEEPSQQDKAMHYSLYYEDFKNENFASALPNLHWVLQNAPLYPKSDDRNYERLYETYEGLALATEDASVAEAYLDSALIIFDTAPSKMDEIGAEYDPFEWKYKKGRFIQTHADKLESSMQAEAAKAYEEAYALDASRLQPYYIEVIIRGYVNQDDKAGAVAFMDDVEATMGDNAEIEEMLARWRDNLFTDPVERIAFLETQLEKNPGDAELIDELFDLYEEEGMRDKMYEMGDLLRDMDPTVGVLTNLAKLRLEDGQPEEALELYQQALEMEGSEKRAREIYYNMGIADQQLGRLSRARTNFRRALEVDPSFGAAIIGIADLYVTAVRNCGTMDRQDRAVYWLATDYYQRAANNDPSVANVAQQKIRTIRPYYPTAEDLFFWGKSAGESYQITGDCYGWIGESTTVRQP